MGVHNIGKYCQVKNDGQDNQSISGQNAANDLVKVKDIGYYCLEMINQNYKFMKKEAE